MQHSQLSRLNRVARKQRGLFTLEQAINAGWDRATVRRWLSHGIWHEVAARVYRFSSTRPSWEDELLAATLSANAIAARRSAAALYGLLPRPREPELLVVRGRRNLDRGAIHSTIDLPPSDVTCVGCIPATRPVRTIIDLAATLSLRATEDLVDQAITRRYVHPVALDRRARELLAPARPGAARVIAALESHHPFLEQARNKWEARLLRRLNQFGLPRPVPNYALVTGGRKRIIDVAWPSELVAIEFDGYEPRMETRRVFDDDRARQNDLVSDGWTVFRVTSTMLRGNAHKHLHPIIRAVSHKSCTGATAV